MKKSCCFVILTMIFTAVCFSQSVSSVLPENAVKEISIDDGYAALHPTASKVKLAIKYTPANGTVQFTYTVAAEKFDQGEACETSRAVLEDFQKKNQYLSYRYKSKDKTKYVTGEDGVRRAVYTSNVVFVR